MKLIRCLNWTKFESEENSEKKSVPRAVASES
jgi:hypothetical protein